MNKYNLDKLVKVECNDFYPARWYRYEKEKKFFGFVTQKAGIYKEVWDNYLGLEVPKNHTLKNGVVYENPEVILHYQADHSKVYYFNSFDEAKKFADEITALGRWQS
jgi:hypothetical protein